MKLLVSVRNGVCWNALRGGMHSKTVAFETPARARKSRQNSRQVQPGRVILIKRAGSRLQSRLLLNKTGETRAARRRAANKENRQAACKATGAAAARRQEVTNRLLYNSLPRSIDTGAWFVRKGSVYSLRGGRHIFKYNIDSYIRE